MATQYYSLDALTKISLQYGHQIDLQQLLKFAEATPIYMYTVCEVLGNIGTGSNTTTVL